jgi:hypothetical protein
MTRCPEFGTASCAMGATTSDPEPRPPIVLAGTPVQLELALAAEVTHNDPDTTAAAMDRRARGDGSGC